MSASNLEKHRLSRVFSFGMDAANASARMHGPLIITRRWLWLSLRCGRNWPLALLVLLPLLPLDRCPAAQTERPQTCALLNAAGPCLAAHPATRAVPTTAFAMADAPPDRLYVPVLPISDLLRIRGPPMG